MLPRVARQAIRKTEKSSRLKHSTYSGQVQTDTDAAVISGLKEGEMVVVSDRSSLKAGEEVRPQIMQLVEYRGPGQREVARRRV